MAEKTNNILFWAFLAVFFIWLFRRKPAAKTTPEKTNPETETPLTGNIITPITPVNEIPVNPNTGQIIPPVVIETKPFQPVIETLPAKLPGLAKINFVGAVNVSALHCVVRDQTERLLYDGPIKAPFSLSLIINEGTDKITVYLTNSYTNNNYEHVIKSFQIFQQAGEDEDETTVVTKNYQSVTIQPETTAVKSPGTLNVLISGGENIERVVLTVKNETVIIAQKPLFAPFVKQVVTVPENCTRLMVMATSYFPDGIAPKAVFFNVSPVKATPVIDPKGPLVPETTKPVIDPKGTIVPEVTTPVTPVVVSPRQPISTYGGGASGTYNGTPAPTKPTTTPTTTSPSGFNTGTTSGGGTRDGYFEEIKNDELIPIDPKFRTTG